MAASIPEYTLKIIQMTTDLMKSNAEAPGTRAPDPILMLQGVITTVKQLQDGGMSSSAALTQVLMEERNKSHEREVAALDARIEEARTAAQAANLMAAVDSTMSALTGVPNAGTTPGPDAGIRGTGKDGGGST